MLDVDMLGVDILGVELLCPDTLGVVVIDILWFGLLEMAGSFSEELLELGFQAQVDASIMPTTILWSVVFEQHRQNVSRC